MLLDSRLALNPLVKRFGSQGKGNPGKDKQVSTVGLVPGTGHPNERVFLSLKMAFLLAFTTARRIGNLQTLTIREPFLLLLEDRVILRQDPLYLPKVTSGFHRRLFFHHFVRTPKMMRKKNFTY